MFRLAVRNLLQNKTRFLISVGGLGLALTLVGVYLVYHVKNGRLSFS